LAEIADPPPLLTVLGDPSALGLPAVAIVGARNASANGRLFARTLAKELAEAGLVVVSGLARGIDTAAHEGVIAAGGRTVAVIASGVDVAYPPENEALMAEIAATGAVVSERPLGAIPQARHFPRRNRIIAGLSLGVVVVEAAPQSGSLITARLAAEQGREVMAVPGSPMDPRHRGTNRLLRDGATLVESAEDVRAALGVAATPPPSRARAPARSRTSPAPPAAPPSPDAPPADLIGRLQERLGVEPLLVDELIRQCHATSSEVQQALLELELEGRIERHPGNRVSLASL
jgi:DNA processing protein